MTYPTTDGGAFEAPTPRDEWDRELEDIRDSHEALVAINRRHEVLDLFSAERLRQIAKWGPQAHPDGTGPNGQGGADVAWSPAWKRDRARDACDAAARAGIVSWRLILNEEVLEAFAENDPAALEKELVQVGAVVTAWLEDLRSR